VDLDYTGAGPTTLAQGDDPKFWRVDPYNKLFSGVIYQRSEIRIGDIPNGTSNTYLIGEKYLPPDNYLNGGDPGDDDHLYVGFDNDTARTTFDPPLHDTPKYQDPFRFGSAHVGGCNMLYCDGSVAVVAYSIEKAIHLRAGDRR
jgi:prepilin-type processing-associated H-X9-DG protein